MAALDILKCSGPSLPAGFSTSNTCRLALALMVSPPSVIVWRLLMQSARSKRATALCVACNAKGPARIPQREHCGKGDDKSAACREACCVAPKICQTRIHTTYGGKQNVEQVYAIHPDCDGTWHRDGDIDLQLSARQPGGDRRRRKPDCDAVPAPDQDDHRAAGVCHPGRRKSV